MSIIGTIFGAPEVIKKGLDLIDSMHTSKTEEIAAKVAGKVALLQAYAPFKVAQRVIAFTFMANFVAAFWMAIYMKLTGTGDLTGFREILSEFWIGEIMMTIVVFYFGGGYIESHNRSKEKPKQSVNNAPSGDDHG